ncbi:MAG: uracil-DNA glycosylase [Candidatus Saccharimonadales bacterium]
MSKVQPQNSTKLLEDLKAEILKCKKCSLHKTRTQPVVSRGSNEIGIMFVGEMPGPDEDKEGRPFIGRAGKLLDEMFLAEGIDTEKCYISNMTRCFAGKIIEPSPEQVTACHTHLINEIKVVNPRILVALGLTPHKGLTGNKNVLMRNIAGTVVSIPGITPLLFTMYHPSWLLRSPTPANKATYSALIKILKAIYTGEQS